MNNEAMLQVINLIVTKNIEPVIETNPANPIALGVPRKLVIRYKIIMKVSNAPTQKNPSVTVFM